MSESPVDAVPGGAVVVGVDGSETSDRALEWAAGYAHPALATSTVVELGDPRQLILRLAERASTVVMGSRGRGPFRSLVLGSVTATVAGRARCPVVVVPPSEDD